MVATDDFDMFVSHSACFGGVPVIVGAMLLIYLQVEKSLVDLP